MKSKNLLIAGALALSTVMTPVASMLSAMPISAAEVTIDANGKDPNVIKDHTFTGYRIFKGTVNNGTLTNIEWAEGINSTGFLNALKTNDTVKSDFSSCNSAAEVANKLVELKDDQAKLNIVAELAGENVEESGAVDLKNDEVEDGYYLIVDTTRKSDMGTGEVRNLSLLKLVGDVTIKVKVEAPHIEKKVSENTKFTDANNSKYNITTGDVVDKTYNDVADHMVGTSVPFAFYSEVPDMTNYKSYKYIIHDKMDPGLTFDAGSVEVKIGGKVVDSTKYSVTTSELGDGCTFHVTFDDLKSVVESMKLGEDKSIVVTFKAVLNENAVIGKPGNTNEVHLEYSNNPYDSEDTGNTVPDKVIVFTYELDATKVDGTTKDVLKNAEFKLLNKTKDKVAVFKKVTKDDVVHLVFDKWVTETASENGYTYTDEDGSTVNVGENLIVTLVSGTDGMFKVEGLDEGEYVLLETKAPTGYSIPEGGKEFPVKIKANTVNGHEWNDHNASSALTTLINEGHTQLAAGEVNNETGVAQITIENSSSSALPETGGMGTTALYAIGAVLTGGAAVFYVTNKRTKRED